MISTLRSLTLGLAVLLSAGAMAQYPYTWVVTGQVIPCSPNTVVTIQTIQGTQPPQNFSVTVDANCGYTAVLNLSSPFSFISLSTMCSGQVMNMWDSASFNMLMDTAFSVIDFNCGGGNYDCMGLLNGPNMPGTPCDDFDPNTTNDTWTANCDCVGTGGGAYDCLGVLNGPDMPGMACDDQNPLTTYSFWDANCVCVPDSTVFGYDCLGQLGGTALPGSACVIPGTNITGTWSANCVCDTLVYDCFGVLGGTNMPGTPCDDNDPNTVNDTWTPNCGCAGTGPLYDCNGVLNGPDMPGTACDDGDPNTSNDTWNSACVCTGGNGLPCDATFVISQAYDSLQNPIPYALFVYTLNNAPGLGHLWTFGDGASSTQAYPVHSYNTPGPFILCHTVTGFGCTHTYCDTLGVDSTGTIIPMGAQGGGFTINVVAAEGTNGVDEPSTTSEIFAIRPNPVLDVLTVDLQATSSESARMEVLDLTGKVVRAEQARLVAGANTLRMDVSALENGTYLLRLIGANGTLTQRFVHNR